MWVRLDDAILDNPKIAAVGVTGFALYVAGLVFCGRNLSNGFIPKERAPLLLPLDADDLRESRTVSALISHGLWRVCDGGYMVHDYLKYNPSRARVLRDRAGARQRMTEVRANFKRTSPEVLGARTRTRTRTRTRSPVPEPGPALSPNGEPAPTSDVASLINKFRSLSGVTADDKDGGLIAGLVGKYGTDRVRQALDEVGIEIGAAEQPRLFLAAVVRNPKPSAKPQTMRERAAELLARQQRIEGKGEAH